MYIVGTLALVAGLFFAWRYFRFATTHIETDDAQVEGNIVPVLARVGGYIATIRVEDNEEVRAGQLLAEIDSTDLALKVEQATIAWQAARSAEGVARSTVDERRVAVALARTAVTSTQSTLWKSQHEFDRYNELYRQQLATPQKLDEVKSALEIAKAQYNMAAEKVRAAEAQLTTAENQRMVAEATTRLRQEEIDMARLQRSYTKIYAPVAGVVSHKSVQAGQLVQPGQPLLSLVEKGKLWVTAHYKETQLEGLDVNNPVVIKVDAYPDIDFTGKVESVGGATGAKFSLIPPDNATGNFVKVVQRISIRIAFDAVPELRLLKPGMSVQSIVGKTSAE